jgi:hypothetical protein
MTDTYFSLAEAGRFCGRRGSDASCARWARRHLLPAIPHIRLPNSRAIIKKQDLENLLNQHRVEPSGPQKAQA